MRRDRSPRPYLTGYSPWATGRYWCAVTPTARWVALVNGHPSTCGWRGISSEHVVQAALSRHEPVHQRMTRHRSRRSGSTGAVGPRSPPSPKRTRETRTKLQRIPRCRSETEPEDPARLTLASDRATAPGVLDSSRPAVALRCAAGRPWSISGLPLAPRREGRPPGRDRERPHGPIAGFTGASAAKALSGPGQEHPAPTSRARSHSDL
jgi:hypothetical protein